MRKKKFYIKAVYDYPDLVFPLHGDPGVFRAWLDALSAGRPMVLEFGAGTCDFLVEQARTHPDTFFLAVEVKPDRLYKGFTKSQTLGLKNIAFMQADVFQLPAYHLPRAETIYLLFSDPWPKKRHVSRRLSSEAFLEIYQNLLEPNGSLILKTDNHPLFEFSLEMLASKSWNIPERAEDYKTPEAEQTAYERRFRKEQLPIYYVKANPPLSSAYIL